MSYEKDNRFYVKSGHAEVERDAKRVKIITINNYLF